MRYKFICTFTYLIVLWFTVFSMYIDANASTNASEISNAGENAIIDSPLQLKFWPSYSHENAHLFFDTKLILELNNSDEINSINKTNNSIILLPSTSLRSLDMKASATKTPKTEVPNTVTTSPLPQPATVNQQSKLKDLLEQMLKTHPQISVYEAERNAAVSQRGVEKSALFPRLSSRFGSGRQFRNAPGVPVIDFPQASEAVVGVNQLLWDFGTTDLAVDHADKLIVSAEYALESQKQTLLLSAIEAYLNVVKTREVLALSLTYEKNLEKIAHFEQEKIRAGRGYTTDLQQANFQIEAARARNALLKDNYQSSRIHFRNIVLNEPDESFSFDALSTHNEGGKSEKYFTAVVASENPDIKGSQIKVALREIERNQGYSKEVLPRIDLQIEKSQRKNIEGIAGSVSASKAMVVASWNFDFGLKANYLSEALTNHLNAETYRAEMVKMQLLEEANILWNTLNATGERKRYLAAQVVQLENYVELIQQEREIGKRTLLDLLNGELSLINARSDFVLAQSDGILQSFRIPKLMGRLNISSMFEPASIAPLAPPR